MSNLSEYLFEQGKREVDIEIATRMIARGKLTLEEIAEDTELEIEEVRELAKKVAVGK